MSKENPLLPPLEGHRKTDPNWGHRCIDQDRHNPSSSSTLRYSDLLLLHQDKTPKHTRKQQSKPHHMATLDPLCHHHFRQARRHHRVRGLTPEDSLPRKYLRDMFHSPYIVWRIDKPVREESWGCISCLHRFRSWHNHGLLDIRLSIDPQCIAR